MSDVSGTAHFTYTIPVAVTGSQLCELSRKIHQEFSANTDYLVCLSDNVASHSECFGRPERLALNKQYFLPEQISSILWMTKSRDEALYVKADGEGGFDVEYRGPGVINAAHSSYYSFLCSVSIAFNEFAHLYMRVKEWARWTSPVTEEQDEAFQEMLHQLAMAADFEQACKHMPRGLQVKLAHAPEPLLHTAWRGLKDILLGVPVDAKHYQPDLELA